MKKYFFVVIALFTCCVSLSQNVMKVTELKRELSIAKTDTARARIMSDLCFAYMYSFDPDSSLHYGQAAYELAHKINFPSGEVRALGFQSFIQHHFGNLPKAMELALKALQIAKDNHVEKSCGPAWDEMASIYTSLKNYPEALSYLRKMLTLGDIDKGGMAFGNLSIADIYISLKRPDSATFYLKKSDSIFRSMGSHESAIFSGFGDLEMQSGNYLAALSNYRRSLHTVVQNNELRGFSGTFNNIARVFQKMKASDSALYYASKGLSTAQKYSQKDEILKAATLLAELYEPLDARTSLHYYKIADATKDSMHNSENLQAIETIIHQQQEQQQTEMANTLAYRNRLKQYLLIAGLLLILLIAGFLFRNNRNKQKANILLGKQKEQIQNALSELKSTQSQLIQSEKMASLGELTAGIAHEIQNPLNFVNNFSELNQEMLSELKAERLKPLAERDQNLQDDLINDVINNEEKINHHGKRADAIVKSMLEHSRTSTGVKELTDINKLADEYLRLAYHGMRAKDKSFNCDLKTEFDESLQEINVVPQDFGRVLLNLFNNAFYACNERSHAETLEGFSNLQGLPYVPTVTVSTIYSPLPGGGVGGEAIITVKDNGNGIPSNIKDKIFQPFFTTKPTGSGTGLGLSLSYDIITKVHNGTIKVESKEVEGTEFIIRLPVN